ncbi:MAG: radical SAM protein, partial [Bdellovibrionales bacterium]
MALNQEPKYGFYDRLTAGFPSQVIVDATEICNLACIHCPHPEFKKSEHYSAASLPLELNTKLVDEVKEHGQGQTEYIRYTSNGEPLVHSKIFEMLKYAVDNSGVFVALTTNGKILSQDRAEKLLSTGLHLVDISIDAFTPETYAQIRVGGKLEVTRRNVENLIRRKSELGTSTKIIVSFVEQPQNSHEVASFESYWKDQGADYVVIRRLHSAAVGVSRIAEHMRGEGEAEEKR